MYLFRESGGGSQLEMLTHWIVGHLGRKLAQNSTKCEVQAHNIGMLFKILLNIMYFFRTLCSMFYLSDI